MDAVKAQRWLESIVSELRREKFGQRSEKLDPEQFNLPLEDVELVQGVLDVQQEKARRALKGQDAAEKGAPNRNSGFWSPGAVVQAHAPEHVARPPLSILPPRGNLHPTEDHAGPSDARQLVGRACFQ